MQKVIKQFLLNEDFVVLKYEDIIEKLEELDIDSIQLAKKTYYTPNEENVVIMEKTDIDHPLVLKKYTFWGKGLYIDPDWYVSHKKEADNLINYIAQNTNKQKLNIFSSCFITSKLIDCLCSNSNLEEISLGGKGEDSYSLSILEYLKFKKSSIKKIKTDRVNSELSEVYDPLINHNFSKELIKTYTYEDLNSVKESNIYINEQLTDEEFLNLKYISPNISIDLRENAIYDVKKICDRLTKLGIKCKVIISGTNKKKINEMLFNTDIKYDNLFISPNYYPIEYTEYLKLEKILYSLIESAKQLSPFEQYIYVYDIVKRFKDYKEVPEDVDKSESRNLNYILENEYMVCVGFSNLFGDLLDKLGINNISLGVGVDVSYDHIPPSKVKSVEFEGHNRRYVHIVDPKYGIDGFYVSDPTWDNDIEKDTYSFLAITDSEVSLARRYVLLNMFDEVFNVTNKDEFYEKLSILIDRERKLYYNTDKVLSYIVENLIKKIKDLDGNFVNNLVSKYPYILGTTYDYPDDLDELLSDIGDYIVSKVNKQLSGEIIFSAVENVYRTLKFYPEDRIDIEIENMKNDTIEHQKIAFPKRSIEYNDGHVEEYDNYINKFAVEEDIKKL